MKLVAYCRVSTEEKGQDPKRQEEVLRAWAEREGHEIVAAVHDEGTSGSIPPLKRQCVQETIELAQEHGAHLVVESQDRWTRTGVEDFFATAFLLRMNHGLEVVMANLPPGMPKEMAAVMNAMMAAGAREYRENMNRQIRSGIQRAIKAGWPKGRPGMPPKPDLTNKEWLMVLDGLDAGKSRRIIALDISKERGAFDVADVKVGKKRRVSEAWIADQAAKRCKENPSDFLRVSARWPAILQGIEEVAKQPEGSA